VRDNGRQRDDIDERERVFVELIEMETSAFAHAEKERVS
jgi:hypothetical protein